MSEWLQFDNPVQCTIRRSTEGHFDDETGAWVAGIEQVVQFTGEIQPKTGGKRAREAGTRYESTHWLQCAPDVDMKPGEVLTTATGSYTVVHVADWGTHIEADLEAVQ